LNHRATELAVRAERGFLKELQGGCQVPIAALAHLEGEAVILRGMVADVDGSEVLRDEERGASDVPEAIGASLAGRLLVAGADRILARIFGET
jgi:hydroxymethylbilane synthase